MPQNRLAMVTGASSGIGEAFARLLAARGDDLVLVARSETRLRALAGELRSRHGVDIEVQPADLVDAGERAVVEKRLRPGLRPVDVLINNAGFGTSGEFAALPLAGEVDEIELNVIALVRLTHAALESMLERGAGAILNVASVAAFQPAPRSATYAATKAFVVSFSQAVHEEVAGAGVKVSCLCPGFTRTRFQERANIDHRHIPGALWCSADDVARAGLAGLDRNVAVVVPGAIYKAAAVATRLVPRPLVRRVAGVVTRHY
jgi:short-subunit dehydrogenase